MHPPLHAIPFVGALFLLITLLALNVSRKRAVTNIYLGDGGNRGLGFAIRAHGNALEHGLLLAGALVLAEAVGLPAGRVLALGWLILGARLLHAGGFLRLGKRFSVSGMVATYALELWLSVYLLLFTIR